MVRSVQVEVQNSNNDVLELLACILGGVRA